MMTPEEKRTLKGLTLKFINTSGGNLPFEDRLTLIDTLIILDKNAPGTYHAKGFLLSNMSRHDEAIQAHDKALDLTPHDWAAFANKGESLNAAGQFNEACSFFEHALTIVEDLERQVEDSDSYIDLRDEIETVKEMQAQTKTAQGYINVSAI